MVKIMIVYALLYWFFLVQPELWKLYLVYASGSAGFILALYKIIDRILYGIKEK